MPFNESSPNDTPNEIDLCSMLNGNEPYVISLRFTGIQSKEKLIIKLKLLTMKAGVLLMLRSTTTNSPYHSQSCTLYCQHGVMFHHRAKKIVRVSKSKWGVGNNDKCKFRIIIALTRDANRWVLKNTRIDF